MCSELEDAREAERARIARELHDEVGQGLLVLRLDLVRLQRLLERDGGTAQQLLNDGLARVDATLNGVKMIINDLHPVVLDQTLSEACAWQVQQFRNRSGLSCKFRIMGTEVELNSRCKNALFRILQESLNNIDQHAQASNVLVVLSQDQQEIGLTVIDDGLGLPASATAGVPSHGIKGMRERAEMLGGVFRIAPVVTGGTVLHVSVPLLAERRQGHPDRRGECCPAMISDPARA